MTNTETVQGQVRSPDGTTISYERSGSGPAVVIVYPSLQDRELGSFHGLRDLLAADFTVHLYDRRGHADSGGTAPDAVQREVEDLGALIEAAGGSASVFGYSAGALLALHAAASGLAIPKLALLEPPIAADEDRAAQAVFVAELTDRIVAGRREAALEHFLTGIGMPPEVLDGLRGTPAWTVMQAVAPRLLHDCALSQASSVDLLAAVPAPTLVLDSAASDATLTAMAATVAAALPNGSHRTLLGEWHGVPDETLAPALTQFFTG